MLQLLNNGHSGTLSTIHTNSAKQGLAPFTSCVLQSGVELPYHAIKTNIADSFNVVVQIADQPSDARRPGRDNSAGLNYALQPMSKKAFIELVTADHKTGITASVIDSADEYTEQNRGSGLGRNGDGRNHRERQRSEFVGSHGSPRDSEPGDLVIFCRWSGFCNRAGHDFSSRRLAKGARI